MLVRFFAPFLTATLILSATSCSDNSKQPRKTGAGSAPVDSKNMQQESTSGQASSSNREDESNSADQTSASADTKTADSQNQDSKDANDKVEKTDDKKEDQKDSSTSQKTSTPSVADICQQCLIKMWGEAKPEYKKLSELVGPLPNLPQLPGSSSSGEQCMLTFNRDYDNANQIADVLKGGKIPNITTFCDCKCKTEFPYTPL